MRIAYVYDSSYPFSKGGGERRIYEVARRLNSRGHDVFILGMKYWDGPAQLHRDGLCYRAICPRLDSYHSSGRRSISQALWFGASAWGMLSHGRYDVIDCGQWPYFHFFPAKACSILRRSTFIVTWYEVWKEHWLEYLGKPGLIGMMAEWAFSRFPDRIVAISEKTQSELLGLGVSQGRMTMIPNGVDNQHIQSVASGRFNTDLAYCGRLKNHKNVHLLIEAVALMKISRPDVSAVIIGEGPESAVLRELAARLGVAGNITFTGALDDFDQVIGWLKASHIFVNPSTQEGGGSITLFEANACGLPVIAIRCGNGIDPRLIREGFNGYLVDLDAGLIARTAQDLLNSPCRLRAGADASRECAAIYDWDSVALQYEHVYLSHLSEKQQIRP
ncbi:MAG TPA: glycosyltransferase family 4 protein [Candidatus Acidoferrales bacterium]|nr:glycosyltransferase family 4 protein [Candidatus Acidoferrales bacterium]